MISKQNSVIHKFSPNPTFEKGAYRFFDNDKVTEKDLIKAITDQCESSCIQKDVTVIIDTCTFCLESKYNRLKTRDNMGIIFQNGKSNSYGFEVHSSLVYDNSDIPLGFSDIELITPGVVNKYEKGKGWQARQEPIEEKQSYKWLQSCEQSKIVLSQAKHITFVADRECDIIELYDRVKDEKSDFLVRSRFNRNTVDAAGIHQKMKDLLSTCQIQKQIKIEVINEFNKNEIKTIGLKYVTCNLKWPKQKNVQIKNHPHGVPVTIIQAIEISEQPKEKKINWILVSSKEIKDINEALTEVKRYEQRWLIEELHKLLKTDGFDLENNQMEQASSVRKLLLMAMKASIKVLQLKASREGATDLKTEEVFDKEEIECLEELNMELKGTTVKQSNPHVKENLAWAAWIIARLGGWKEFYNAKRPPGNKTFADGLDRFDAILMGYKLKKRYVS